MHPCFLILFGISSEKFKEVYEKVKHVVGECSATFWLTVNIAKGVKDPEKLMECAEACLYDSMRKDYLQSCCSAFASMGIEACKGCPYEQRMQCSLQYDSDIRLIQKEAKLRAKEIVEQLKQHGII